jgi:hypothetical protein
MKKKEKVHQLNNHTLYHLTDIINDEENFICNLSDICFDEMIYQVFNILSLIYGPKDNIEFITYDDQTLWREKGTDKAQFIVFSNIH